MLGSNDPGPEDAEDRRFMLGSNDPSPECRGQNAEYRRFTLGSNDPGPADLSFARSPLAGRPRLLGAAAHSGLYRDRTAGGAGDECMRSRQGGELARRPFHRMR
jgi:hypothetical protein